jgi:DNA topoisomerase-1
MLAARALATQRSARNERVARKRIAAAIDLVSDRLGNTREICRRCYVHPAVVAAFSKGTLPLALRRPDRSRKASLSLHEAAVAGLLTRASKSAARAA